MQQRIFTRCARFIDDVLFHVLHPLHPQPPSAYENKTFHKRKLLMSRLIENNWQSMWREMLSIYMKLFLFSISGQKFLCSEVIGKKLLSKSSIVSLTWCQVTGTCRECQITNFNYFFIIDSSHTFRSRWHFIIYN